MTSQEFRSLINFWKLHPEPFIYNASAYFGFFMEELQRYWRVLDWSALSGNTSIEWSAELIEEFSDQLLVINHPYSKDELKYLDEYGIEPLHFHMGLQMNTALSWTADFLEQYQSRFSWTLITQYPPIHVDLEVLGRFKEHWDWFYVSALFELPFDTDLLEQYKDYWHYRVLFLNKSFFNELEHGMMDLILEKDPEFYPEAVKLIEPKEKEETSYEETRFLYQFFTSRGFLSNEELEFAMNRFSTCELIQFERTPWSPGFIDYFAERFDWIELCDGREIPFTPDLVEKCLDKVHFGSSGEEEVMEIHEFGYSEISQSYHPGLSGNYRLPWSIELIRRYEEKWFWNELSRNPSIPWNPAIIDAFANRWDWGILSATNSCLDIKSIYQFKDRLDWTALSTNEDLNWTFDLLYEFREMWDYKAMCMNETVFRKFIQPLLRPRYVNMILEAVGNTLINNHMRPRIKVH